VILYSSFLSMAPFILLAVTAGAFGPWGRAADDGWSYTFLWDVAMVLTVIAGGILSVLVLGDVVNESDTTQDLVVVAGCVSLGLLATHVLVSVTSLYRSERRDRAGGETPGVKDHAEGLGRPGTAAHEGAGSGAGETGVASRPEFEGTDSVGDAPGPR
jgi:hypothetical protein